MPHIIVELWILSVTGIPLVNFCEETKLNEILFSALISSILSFVESSTLKELNSFTMGNYKFTCKKCLDDNVIMVGRSLSNANNKKIQQSFRVIANFFEDMFTPSDLKNWDGDISFFDKYKEKLDLYFRMSEL